MKRKTIQLAKKTLVLSLPTAWVKKHSINKGDEIHIEEQEKSLVLTPEIRSVKGESIEVNHEKIGKLIHRYMNKQYEKGVDEIKINFTDPQMLIPIKKSLKELIGYEVITQGQKHCIIKDVSGQNYTEFENSLNRLFLILKNILEDGHSAIKNKNYELLEAIIKRDEDVNKFSHFCLRILSKFNGNIERSDVYFFIINLIERIGDEYKFMLKEICSEKGNFNTEVLEKINELYNHVYKFTINTKIENALQIADFYDELKESEAYLKGSSVNHYMRTLTELIVSIQEAQLGLICNAGVKT